VWRGVDPALGFVVLPLEGRVADDDIARIDLAVFSSDLWREGRGSPFMRVLLDAPNAVWLHMFAAGLDDPVFALLGARGLTVTHSAGSSAVPIAHTVMMQLIAMCRRGRGWQLAQSERRWEQGEVDDVEGRRVTVVGLGAIGTEVARLAQQFGMSVTGLRRNPLGDEPCTTLPIHRLHEVLPSTDDLVLTAPLSNETRGLIGAAELALLPPGARLVNVGRGELVDEQALIDALRSGHVGSAALDVFTVEPLPHDSPLWSMPNVLITPHSSGSTDLAERRAADVFVDNLRRLAAGDPLRNVGYGTDRPAMRSR
jgi:D-2-hydroxyacid dehydrogenase (NADP+)